MKSNRCKPQVNHYFVRLVLQQFQHRAAGRDGLKVQPVSTWHFVDVALIGAQLRIR